MAQTVPPMPIAPNKETRMGTKKNTSQPPAPQPRQRKSRSTQAKREFAIRLGNQIRDLRTERGLTIDEMAAKIASSNAYISRLERGHIISPGMDVLTRIAKVLNVPVYTLTGESGPRRSEVDVIVTSLQERVTPEQLMEFARAAVELSEEDALLLWNQTVMLAGALHERRRLERMQARQRLAELKHMRDDGESPLTQ